MGGAKVAAVGYKVKKTLCVQTGRGGACSFVFGGVQELQLQYWHDDIMFFYI